MGGPRPKVAARIDTQRARETPEGVELSLRVASPMARGGAYVADLLIRMFVLYGLLIGIGFLAVLIGLEGLGNGFALILFFGFEWFYFVVFEVGRHQASPGKRMFGLRVVHRDGTPVGLEASLIRNLLRVVDLLPMAYGVGIVASLSNRDFARVGDLVAGTLVVHHGSETGRKEMAAGEVWAPPLPLNAAEQLAVLDFADRAADWLPSRQAELADHLAPLTGLTGSAGVERVLALARWLRR